MRHVSLLSLFLFGSGCAPAPEAQHPAITRLALAHINVVDVESGRVFPDQTVLILRTRIERIGPAGSTSVPVGARVVNSSGKYLIPGLWDMHAHIPGPKAFAGVTGADFLPLYVAAGVTGIRDMGADCVTPPCVRWMRESGDLAHWRDEIRAGRLAGPRMVAAGPVVDGPVPVHQGSLIVASADDGRRAVREHVARGASFVKVYDRVPREAYAAIAREARIARIPVSGHVPTSVSASEASDAGQRSLEHLWLVLDACSSVESELLAKRRNRMNASMRRDTTFPFTQDYRELTRRALGTFSRSKCQDLAERFIRNGTWMVPTSAGTWGSAMACDSAFAKRAVRAGVPPWLQTLLAPFAIEDSRRPREDTELRQQWHQHKLVVLRLLHRAGVQILGGTDNPGSHTYPGFSLHDELELLVEAGLSSLEALQTATLKPARFLNATDSLGVVASGKLADLVILDANPLDEIQNTRRVHAVVIGGRFLDREALNRLLAPPATLSSANLPLPFTRSNRARSLSSQQRDRPHPGFELRPKQKGR